VIKAKQARVRNYCVPNVLKGTLASVRPDTGNWFGILALGGKLTKRGDPEFKVVDVFAIKLRKANKFCNIAHYLWARPRLQKLMLRLSRPVPFGADVVPHEFETFGEDEAFTKAQGQTV